MSSLFSDNTRWADVDAWRAAAVELHDDGPIHHVPSHNGIDDFWAVIGHAEVLDIERQNDLFHNAPEPVLGRAADQQARRDHGGDIKTLIHMDDPEHHHYRLLTAPWFRPKSLGRLQPRLDELADQALAKLVDLGGECDFATDIAMECPLQVILAILGLPEEDYPRMLKLTQELFGAEDPELQREPPDPEKLAEVLLDFYGYFSQLTADRRSTPTEDLATLIANGRIEGEPMPDLETMSYYVIVATAGHDTTSHAMAAGLHALATHPEQLRLLQQQPELLNNAVDEIIRWAAPVRHFMRTATVDTEVGGQPIAAGDWLYLSYLAANVDPSVFDDPLRFDITRPNADKHLAFGYGVHYCLGAQLARMELRTLFGRLVPRLASLELSGPAPGSQTTFVGGLKHVPVRYELTPA